MRHGALFAWILFFLLVSTTGGPAWGKRGERLGPEERYELGQRYLKRGYYTKALEQFNRIRNYHRDDPYALKAELAIADLHFKKAEWDQARLAYQDFKQLHPQHEDIDYVVFRLGLCLWKKAPAVAARDQVWTRQAVNVWSGFEVRYADSEYLDEVRSYLEEGRNRLARKELLIARFYYRREAWEAAISRLEDMLATYSETEDRAEALALLSECHARLGDMTASERARDRLHRMEGEKRWKRRLDRRLQRLERRRARRLSSPEPSSSAGSSSTGSSSTGSSSTGSESRGEQAPD